MSEESPFTPRLMLLSCSVQGMTLFVEDVDKPHDCRPPPPSPPTPPSSACTAAAAAVGEAASSGGDACDDGDDKNTSSSINVYIERRNVSMSTPS